MEEFTAAQMDEITRRVRTNGQVDITFSQLGEDRILWWIFHQQHNGFYVDIGCHHPYRLSNTALLHLLNGWSGINVDMDERAIAAFRHARPNDVSICAAIGGTRGQLEAAMFEHGAFNTLDPRIAAQPALAGFLTERRMVDVMPLGDILHAHVPMGRRIDLLNVDIEGLDHAALASNDWDAFAPSVIVVEIHGFDVHDPRRNPTYELLTGKSYRLVAHLVATTIFARQP